MDGHLGGEGRVPAVHVLAGPAGRPLPGHQHLGALPLRAEHRHHEPAADTGAVRVTRITDITHTVQHYNIRLWGW